MQAISLFVLLAAATHGAEFPMTPAASSARTGAPASLDMPTPTATPTPTLIDPNNILVSGLYGNAVLEYTPTGSLVQAIPFNYKGHGYPGAEYLRGIVVSENGVIAGYNGTFQPYMTRYFSTTNTFTHANHPGWSTVNNIYSGGIAAYQTYVFVADSGTCCGGEPRGIVRFDTCNNTAVRFATNIEFARLTMGLDGNLYAPATSAQINVYNPISMSLIREIIFTTPPFFNSTLAVDQAGHLFIYNGGSVYRLTSNGAVEASKATGFFDLRDIAIDASGRIIVSAIDTFTGVRVLVGESTLTNEFMSFPVNGAAINPFVAFARPILAYTPCPTPTPSASPEPTSTPSPTESNAYLNADVDYHSKRDSCNHLDAGPKPNANTDTALH